MKLNFTAWGNDEKKRIDKLFNGEADDWKKKSLKNIKDALKSALFELQQHKCFYCKREIIDEIGRVEIDHVIPKSLAPGFTFEKLNLVLTCKRCNHRKNEHNPTIEQDQLLKELKVYPNDQTFFVWIHPYLHNYSEHISIQDDCVFISLGGSKNGLSVIKVCKLDQMNQVMSRLRSARIKRNNNVMYSIMELASSYPTTNPKTLAQEIANVHGDNSVDDVAETIELLRKLNGNQTPKDLNNFLKKFDQ